MKLEITYLSGIMILRTHLITYQGHFSPWPCSGRALGVGQGGRPPHQKFALQRVKIYIFANIQKENRTFSHSDHCNDPFPNHKLHIQIIIIWCYHYYSKQLFAKKRECLLKNIPKINEKPIFSVFSETLIPQFVKADKYLDMIFRTSFYTSMID